jgi:transcriptional regulator with XRE-family HTH domain
MTLGSRIKFFRNQLRMSQKDIEMKTNIPQTTLSGWENDKYEPTLSDAKKLATALGVTVSDLLGENDFKEEDCNTKLVV